MDRKLLENFEIDKKAIDKIQEDADKAQDALTEDVLTEEGSDIGRNGITYMNYDAVVAFLIGPYPFRKEWPIERDESRTAYDSFMNVLLPAQKKVEAEEQALNDFISKLTDGSDASVSMNPNGVPASNIEYNVIRGNYDVLSRKGISEDAVNKLRQHVGKISQRQIDRDSALDELDKTRKLLAVRKAGLGGSKPVLAPFQTSDIYFISPKYRKGLKNAGWEHLNGDTYTKQHGYADELDGENSAEYGNSGSIPGRNGNNPATWTIFQSEAAEKAFFEEQNQKQDNRPKYEVIKRDSSDDVVEENKYVSYEDAINDIVGYFNDHVRYDYVSVVFIDKENNEQATLSIDDDFWRYGVSPESVELYIDRNSEEILSGEEQEYVAMPVTSATRDIVAINKQEAENRAKEAEEARKTYGNELKLNTGDRVHYKSIKGEFDGTVIDVRKGNSRGGYDTVTIRPDEDEEEELDDITVVATDKFLTPLHEWFKKPSRKALSINEKYDCDGLSRSDSAVVKYMLKEGYSEKTINSFLRKRGKR